MARLGGIPVVEGEGQKPTTPKPDLRHDVLLKAQVGHPQAFPKPQPPAPTGPSRQAEGRKPAA